MLLAYIVHQAVWDRLSAQVEAAARGSRRLVPAPRPAPITRAMDPRGYVPRGQPVTADVALAHRRAREEREAREATRVRRMEDAAAAEISRREDAAAAEISRREALAEARVWTRHLTLLGRELAAAVRAALREERARRAGDLRVALGAALRGLRRSAGLPGDGVTVPAEPCGLADLARDARAYARSAWGALREQAEEVARLAEGVLDRLAARVEAARLTREARALLTRGGPGRLVRAAEVPSLPVGTYVERRRVGAVLRFVAYY